MVTWRTHESSRGFTIIELLVVIVVIAILAAVTVVAYSGVQARAVNTKIIASVSGSAKLLNMYRIEHGTWPEESITPAYFVYKYCLGREYPLFTMGGTSNDESPNIRIPRRACTDDGGNVKFEAGWMADVVASYGVLPRAAALRDEWRFAPIYGVVYSGYSLAYAGLSGITYPVVNGVTQNGTAHFIEFSLMGDVPNCGNVQNAQKLVTHDGVTACLIMLELYGA